MNETDHKALVKHHRETETPLPDIQRFYLILAVHHEECPLVPQQEIDENEYKKAQRLYKGF